MPLYRKPADAIALSVSIDKADILNIIYAESAWFCANHPEARRLTSDVSRLIMMKVKQGYDDLHGRVLGYLLFANFNPNLEAGNVQMTFQFFHPVLDTQEAEMKEIVTQILAQYALKCFYGADTVADAAWLKYRAQLLLVFARDTNYDLLR